MKYLLLSAFLFTLITCKPSPAIKYPFTIEDFPDSLRTDLTKIVNYGFIGSPSYEPADNLRKRISDEDCKKLSLSEHPILRSLALDILCNRHHLDHYAIMMQHLDDTAYVNWHFQCASFTFITVSDYMVKEYHWYTEKQKTTTADKIIREHNYLQCASEALQKITLTQEYYPFVKQMAERETLLKFRSRALSELAGFKRKEDQDFLHETLEKPGSEQDCNTFGIMERYHHPDYFNILKKYYRNFFRIFCSKDFEWAATENALCYIDALASYQSEESAAILEKILFREPLLPCYPADTFRLREHLYEAIEKNACPSYSKMLRVAIPWLKKERAESEANSFLPDTSNFYHFPPDTSRSPKIRW